jgi:proteasome assembly chaperone (PAC2) family protein
MLEVDTWPRLRDPVLVVALTGWVDAGMAGTGTIAAVVEQLESARRFARLDLGDLMDLQQHRPTIELQDGVSRHVEWPSIDLIAGHAGRDVVLVVGPEPSLRWRSVVGELVDASRRIGVTRAVTLGGVPAVASHRRPVTVTATATNERLIDEVGAWRVDYRGPVGAQTVFQHELGQAGIDAVALWAQVPHYVAGTPSPPAIRALLDQLRRVAGVRIELQAIEERAAAYVEQVDAELQGRADIAELVAGIEGAEPEPPLPSGDELASEIERFLRDET